MKSFVIFTKGSNSKDPQNNSPIDITENYILPSLASKDVELRDNTPAILSFSSTRTVALSYRIEAPPIGLLSLTTIALDSSGIVSSNIVTLITENESNRLFTKNTTELP